MTDWLKKFNLFFTKRIILLFIIFAVINILAHLPVLNLYVDIMSHFKLQYYYISFLFIAAFIYLCFFNRKFIFLFGLSVLICLINFIEINKYYYNSDKTSSGQGIKISLFNVYTANRNFNSVLDEIKVNNPDIVILQETDKLWLENVSILKEQYPYYKEQAREDNFGIALYSKIKFIFSDTEEWTEYLLPVIRADFDYKNSTLSLYCVHTLPPANKEYINTRNEMLNQINSIIMKNKDKNIIIAGDLNTTVYSYAYKKFIASTKITDAQTKKGIKDGTWSTLYIPFFRLPLEHILVTDKIKINSYKLGKNIGSDHFPVHAYIDIK